MLFIFFGAGALVTDAGSGEVMLDTGLGPVTSTV